MTTMTRPEVEEQFRAIAAGFRSRGLAPLLSLRIADPFARQELARLIGRDASLADRIRSGFTTSSLERPPHQPITARDVIDFYGFRVIHCQTVGNAISDVIGRAHMHAGTHEFWEWTFIRAMLASVIAEKLERFGDEAYAATFIRGAALRLLRDLAPGLAGPGAARAEADGVPLWDGERAAFGASHLDLARALAVEWGLPRRFLPAFDADATSDPDAPAGLILRAEAVAERAGFADPEGPALPPAYVREREPILDAFVHRVGGPSELAARVRSMLTTARVPPA